MLQILKESKLARYLSSVDKPTAPSSSNTALANEASFKSKEADANDLPLAVKTEDGDEYYRPPPKEPSMRNPRYWGGVEISARTYFITECSVNVEGVTHVRTYVTPDFESAKFYMRRYLSINWWRILVRMRGPVGERYSWKLEELSEVYRCPKTGAFVYVLKSGFEVLDRVEPATDSSGTQTLDVVYSTTRPYSNPILYDV